MELGLPLDPTFPATRSEIRPKVSWTGILLYVCSIWSNYLIGYFAVYRPLKWLTAPDVTHGAVRVLGDLVTLGWFAFAFACLPWHRWEERTFIGTKHRRGLVCYVVWCLGIMATLIVYGALGQIPAFETSFGSNDPVPGKRLVSVMAIVLMALVVLYWIIKLRYLSWYRRQLFLKIFCPVVAIFIISYVVCSSDEVCEYHLHHWWFGFVFVLISTTMLDNRFDYLMQGVFWAFIIESLFNYGFVFRYFFV